METLSSVEIHRIDNARLVNATPHPITFQRLDGELIEVPPCKGLSELIKADVQETVITSVNGVEIVTPKFQPSVAGSSWLKTFKEDNPNVLVVGSIIAAQAYKFPVVALVPVPGYERVPPQEKRMRTDKFTSYRGEKPAVRKWSIKNSIIRRQRRNQR